MILLYILRFSDGTSESSAELFPGAYRDVSLHAFHLRQLAFVDEFGLFPAAAHQDLARDLRVAYLSERHPAFFVNVADYLLHERFAAVAFVRNEHFFTFLDSAGIADEQVSRFSILGSIISSRFMLIL